MKSIAILSILAVPVLGAQGYPVAPRPLREADEIALAMSAAPAEVSSKADIYVLRGTAFVKVKTGSNGCACMVGRDSHEGSRYPICFDAEGAKTSMLREMREGSLRAKGTSEADIKRVVDAAYKSGELKRPTRTAMAYMMSPKQVLFSAPTADGVSVGAWAPHVMITMPDVHPSQMGLADSSSVDVIEIHPAGEHHAQLIVKVPTWSDGKPAVNKAP